MAKQKTATAPLTVGQRIDKAKEKMNNRIAKAKQDFKEYKAKIKYAQKVGYDSGKRDIEKLPEAIGVNLMAQKSYGEALRDGKKVKKIQKKMKKGK